MYQSALFNTEKKETKGKTEKLFDVFNAHKEIIQRKIKKTQTKKEQMIRDQQRRQIQHNVMPGYILDRIVRWITQKELI